MKNVLLFLVEINFAVLIVSQSCKMPIDDENNEKREEPGTKYHQFHGKCTLKEVFNRYMGKDLDEKTSSYLSADSLHCSGVKMYVNKSYDFECNTYEGFVVLTPRHLQTSNGKTDFLIKTTDNNYKNMVIDINGPFRSTSIKVHKDTNQDDMVMKTNDLLSNLNVDEFLKTHFNVELKKISGDLDVVPSSLDSVSLVALIKPKEYFELVFYPQNGEEFFVIQMFESATAPSIGFFKKLEEKNPLEIINEKLKMNIEAGFMPFLESSVSSFSTCTSSIPVIMSTPQRDLVENFMTESNTVAMPEGKMLRWVMDDSKKVKKTAENIAGERTNADDGGINKKVYSSKIGFTAIFSEDIQSDINIVSKDTLQAHFKDIIQTFVPKESILLTESNKIFHSIFEKDVFFNKLSIIAKTKQINVHVMITEDWFVGGNLVNLKGMNLTATTSFSTETPWIVGGEGNIFVLGKSVFSKIEKIENQLFLTGDFPSRKINEIRSLYNHALFVPDDYSDHLKHLDELSFSAFSLMTKLDSPVLKFYGESPSYANPTKLNSVSLLEIVLKGNEQKQNMVVGLCQDNVILERMINEVFHLAMEGVSWLKFEKLCFLLAKDITDELSYFNETILSGMKPESGIHYVGKLSLHSKCAFMGPESSEINSKDYLCQFLIKNPLLIEANPDVTGFISPTNHEFIAKNGNSELIPLKDDDKLNVKDTVLHLKQVKTESSENEQASQLDDKSGEKKDLVNVVIHEISKKKIMGLFIEGTFSASETTYKLDFLGIISKHDAGKLKLSCKNVVLQFDTGSGFIRFRSQGESIAENTKFNFFEFMAPISVNYNKVKLVFKKSAQLKINLKKPEKAIFFANSAKNTDVKSILMKFVENHDHVIFADIKSVGNSLYVWTPTDKKIIQASNQKAPANQLTIFGSVERSGKLNDYKIAVKSNFLKYMEYLSPIKFSNGMLRFLSHDGSNTKGSKLVAFWRFDDKNPNVEIKGHYETLGLSKDLSINVSKSGKFELLNESNESFFNELQAVITISQKRVISTLDSANPYFHVNLMPGKSHIEDKVKEHIKSLSEQYQKAYNHDEFVEFVYNAEELTYKPVSDVREILLPLHETIIAEIKSLEELYGKLSKDCVEECNSQGTVDIPSIVWDNEQRKMILVPDEYKTANITCIVACELEKSHISPGYENKINEIKILMEKYEDLKAQAEGIHKLYRTHEKKIYKEIDHFKNMKTKFSDFPDIAEKLQNTNDFFELIAFEFKGNMNKLKLKGDKCIENFFGMYKMFGVQKNFTFCQCFNGEYAKYFAEKLAENYIGKQKLRNLNKLLKLHDDCVTKYENNLRVLKAALSEFFDKHGNKELLPKNEKRSSFQFNGSPPRRMRGVLRKHHNHTLVFSTRSIYLPFIDEKDRAHLNENKFTVTRSMKTRNTFMYSSPWAAVNSFYLERSFENADFFHRDVQQKKSHCSVVERVSNQYADIYKGVHSISDSYEKTAFKLSQIYHSMKKSADTLRNKAMISSNNTKPSSREDQLYWVRQLEKGMNLYSELVKKKLSNHSATALNTFKSKFEDGLKRSGIPDIPTFMNTLRQQFDAAAKRALPLSSARSIGVSSADKMSNVLMSVLKKPELKLHQMTDRIKLMKRYMTNISGIATTCSR